MLLTFQKAAIKVQSAPAVIVVFIRFVAFFFVASLLKCYNWTTQKTDSRNIQGLGMHVYDISPYLKVPTDWLNEPQICLVLLKQMYYIPHLSVNNLMDEM